MSMRAEMDMSGSRVRYGVTRLGSLACVGAALMGGSGCAPEVADPEIVVEEAAQELSIGFRGDVVVTWNEHTMQALTEHDGYADPLMATRVLALVHLAMHDAVNATAYRFYDSYAFHGRDLLAHPEAAAASAAAQVLARLFPAQESVLLLQLQASLSRIPDGFHERRGVRLGERAAEALLALREHDGSSEVLPYTPGDQPGDYQFTVPSVIARPGWQNVTPWGLASAEQFRPGPPPALDSALYARDFEEVERKGNLGANTRTDDETRYAQFWYEFSDLGWNRVTRVVAQDQKLSLARAARLFALVNMALADSYIAGWDAKFFYDFWRPVTAIHAADLDGNPATAPDATWQSFLFTPPVQDYPSTHSTLGAAAAEVLTRFFGRRGDRVGFTMTSSSASEPNVETRTFESFEAAALENADSRVMAGLHFRFSCEAGLELGREIGGHILENHLRPRGLFSRE